MFGSAVLSQTDQSACVRSVASACLQVFPRMANFTNTHKMTGVGNALKRHYQALCLDYELAHPEDLDKQVTLNTPALQIRIRCCLLLMGALMGSEVQCQCPRWFL